jgi:hypothetical protein
VFRASFLSKEDETGLNKHIMVLQDDKLRGLYAPNIYFQLVPTVETSRLQWACHETSWGDTTAYNAGTLL